MEPSSDQSTVDASITLLTAYLQNNYQRVPKGAEKALKEILKLKETTTERIFLDHGGKQAWLAFHCVTRFPRRTSERTTINSFRKLSIESQKEVARRVGKSTTHFSIATVINKLSIRRLHRPKLENLTQPTVPSITSSSCAITPILNQIQIIPTTKPDHSLSNDIQHDPRIAIAYLVNTSSHETLSPAPNETQTIPITIPEHSSSNDIERIEVYGHFPHRWIAEGLDKSLCDVVEMVTMSFSRWATEDCVMTLVIPESKVEYLAKSLFVHCVGTLVFPGGAKALPYPAVFLKGVEADIITRVFGVKIFTAIMASCLRAEDLANGVEKPQGVSMTMPVGTSGPVVMELILEAFSAFDIAEKITP